MTDGKATTPQRFWSIANEFGFTFNWAYVSRKATAYFSSGCCRGGRGASTAACRRSAPVSTSGTASSASDEHPHDTSGPHGLAAQLEQPVGARLHARRRRAVRLGPARRAVQPVAEARAHHRRRQHHEPGRHRGRPRARVARRQPGAAHGAGAERARPGGRRHARRLGGPRRAPPRRRQQRALRRGRPGDHGRALAADRRRRDVAGVRDLARRPRRGPRPRLASGESYVDKDLRTLLGKRVRDASTSATAAPALCSLPELAVAGGPSDRRPARHAARPTRPGAVAGPASRTGFIPGLLPNTFPTTNRPTFQQVLELQRHGH